MNPSTGESQTNPSTRGSQTNPREPGIYHWLRSGHARIWPAAARSRDFWRLPPDQSPSDHAAPGSSAAGFCSSGRCAIQVRLMMSPMPAHNPVSH
jgi:hypothetical protein